MVRYAVARHADQDQCTYRHLQRPPSAVFRAAVGRMGAATQQGTALWRPTSTRYDDGRWHSEDAGGAPAYRRIARRLVNAFATNVQPGTARHGAADLNRSAQGPGV